MIKNKVVVIFCIFIGMILSDACAHKSEQASAGESKITVHTWGNEFLLGPSMDMSSKYLVFLPLIFNDGDGEPSGLLRSWK